MEVLDQIDVDRHGPMARWFSFIVLPLVLIIAATLALRPITAVSGVVRDSAGRPVANATVRIKGGDTATITDADGRFLLSRLQGARRVHLTAWREGFYIGRATVWPWSARVVLRLSRHAVSDHRGYRWQAPSVDRPAPIRYLLDWSLTLADRIAPDLVLPIADRFVVGCRDCHAQIFDEWSGSAHALGAANPRFLTLYNGATVDGAQSPPMRYAADRDYGRVPLRPEPATDRGPGFRLDYPDTTGNCATCHLPGAALDDPFTIDPNTVTGISARGTHCDFCHKTHSVVLDSRTGLPPEERPGVLSMRIVRPSSGAQLFFGPYDDVDAGRDTRGAAMQQSAICAGCHQASFWGVPIYESFAEWKASPYAAEGRTCQSCHMKPDGITTNFAPRRGGVPRSASAIATHRFEGAMSQSLLRSAARLGVDVTRSGDRLHVSVSVENTGAGHRLPTDSPLREMLLVVDATDDFGSHAALVDGPVLPPWAGDLAARPGLYFAKVLEQRWTGVVPTAAYWTQTRIVEDTRLPPRASVTRRFEFLVSSAADVTVAARLVLRRAPFALMRQKGWQVPDIEMTRAVVRSNPAALAAAAVR
jgi:hypothetical protein